MTIIPDSIVVANDEFFSFIVPNSDLLEALELRVVPDDFPNESLRGLAPLSATVSAKKGPDHVRVMFRHAPNPKSTVKRVAKEG